MKKLIGMLAGAFCLALAVMMVKPIEARADEGRYVLIKYDNGGWYERINNGYWIYIQGGVVDIEDGDTILVDAGDQHPASAVPIVTDKRIGTLAVCGDVFFTIDCPTPADLVYAANGATLIYNGNAKKVVCNPGCRTQINGNVDDVEAKYLSNSDPIFAVTGTVGVLHCKMTDGIITTDLAYDFAAGTVHSDEKGVLYVEAGTLKGAPGAAAGNSNGSGNSNGRELDDVPRTGSGVNTSVIFFGISALLAITAVTVKRKESVKQ